MKHVTWIFALLLMLSACGKQEEAAAPAIDETAVVEEPATEPETEADSTGTATEELVVVEESASDAAPSDESIKLAMAESPAAQREWQFKEGEHYVRMVPAQPTVGGADKIEVAEFFWYGCPHCYDLEPYVNAWEVKKNPNVR
ncbi:MAG: hypothetical protein KJN77_01610, partial [Gammaproteobacteria bacterium]|nr:hypothetical protein [Gammaproteobacteria bacterium]